MEYATESTGSTTLDIKIEVKTVKWRHSDRDVSGSRGRLDARSYHHVLAINVKRLLVLEFYTNTETGGGGQRKANT